MDGMVAESIYIELSKIASFFTKKKVPEIETFVNVLGFYCGTLYLGDPFCSYLLLIRIGQESNVQIFDRKDEAFLEASYLYRNFLEQQAQEDGVPF